MFRFDLIRGFIPLLYSLFIPAFIDLPASGSAHAGVKPNVLLICVDDLKPALGCYGDTLAKTPNIDRLATRSVLFESAYCNQAVCAPSRNSLLTGLRPQTLGIYDLGTNFRKSRPDAVTMPQHFKGNGYHTAALGKIFHVGHGNFEDAASWSVPHFKANVVGYALPESKASQGLTREEALFDNKPAAGLPRGAVVEAADVPDETYADGKLAQEAVLRLRQASQKPDQPFFLAVGFVKPHLPFVAPKKYWELYQRDQFSLASIIKPPAGAPAYAPTTWGELRQYQGVPQDGPLSEELQQQLIHGYYAATSYMDAQVGLVLNELDRLKLTDQTLIVLWGDHGWHLGDHGMWCKHSNYEQATRIPLLISVPGGRNNVKTKALIETVDIYPTLCQLTGLPTPAGLDGRSQSQVLSHPDAKLRDHVIHVYPRSPQGKGQILGRAIRTDRYRLVQWKAIDALPETAEYELYDYQEDPLETRNLASGQPEVVEKLLQLLASHPEAKRQIKAGEAAASGTDTKPAVKTDRNQLFASKDKNSDGQLSHEEFMKNQPDGPAAAKRFVKFDTNQDGVLSKEEFVGGNSSGKRQQ